MFLWDNDFQSIFWVAAIPAVLSIALLGFGLKEPNTSVVQKRTNPLRRENLKKLSAAYWWVVAIGSIFTLARFSEAFLVLRAQQMALPLVRHTASNGRHEPGLQPDCLSFREIIGQDEPQQNAAVGPAGADCRRYRAGAE